MHRYVKQLPPKISAYQYFHLLFCSPSLLLPLTTLLFKVLLINLSLMVVLQFLQFLQNCVCDISHIKYYKCLNDLILQNHLEVNL